MEWSELELKIAPQIDVAWRAWIQPPIDKPAVDQSYVQDLLLRFCASASHTLAQADGAFFLPFFPKTLQLR